MTPTDLDVTTDTDWLPVAQQIDTGAYQLNEGTTAMGYVWVVDNGGGQKTEYYGLFKNWVNPGSNNTPCSWTFTWLASYSWTDTASFKTFVNGKDPNSDPSYIKAVCNSF